MKRTLFRLSAAAICLFAAVHSWTIPVSQAQAAETAAQTAREDAETDALNQASLDKIAKGE